MAPKQSIEERAKAAERDLFELLMFEVGPIVAAAERKHWIEVGMRGVVITEDA